ncbi:DUF6541 family protein [Companilactobacillus baiquanensis]|uniref:DUF6541 family protein n=1 Tax=Companilactobacillus baiquanensis TaxID=2486005 RepID=A0ABW1UTX4_9LACO|nr:DUF6541 family protein [Companilactobacillus baiquanensis]
MSNKALKRTILGTVFLVLSILYTILFSPHATIRLLDSYDMLFHLNRVNSLGNILVSPVNFNYWDHVGNFTNLFYPWFTITPGFLIFKVFSDPVISFLIFLTIITFLTFVSSYYFMAKFSNNTLQAFLFSILYTLSFFRVASVFYRVGLAEYISYIFIPMIFYAFAKILSGEFNKWPLFAAGLTLTVLTHPLTAFITVVMLVPLVVLVLFSKVSHSFKYWGKLIWAGIQSVFLVVIASLGFILPMVEQKRSLAVNRPALLDLAQMAQKPMDLFNNALHTDVRSYSIGIISLLTILVIVIFIWKDQFKYRVVAIEGLIALVLSTSIFPWQIVQNTFFNLMQFPWRFLNMVTFFFAIYLSHILAKLMKDRSSLTKLSVLVLTTIACGSQVYLSATRVNSQPSPFAIVDSKNADQKIQSFHQEDYYPLQSLPYSNEIKSHKFIINDKKTKIPFKTTDNTYLVKYYNKESVDMDIPVLFYKGLNVSINNEAVKTKISKRGTVEIKTQQGQNNIQIKYHYTKIAIASMLVSVVGFIILIWLLINNGHWSFRKLIKDS